MTAARCFELIRWCLGHRKGVVLFCLGTLLVIGTASGCVRRRLTIRSNPPGAVVYVDEQRIGSTPVSTEFTYYGSRRIRLVKDGFETLSTLQRISPPWYQYPPIDFVTENMIGREIRDERILQFQLQPQRLVPTQELLTRANNLRVSNGQNVIAPQPRDWRVPTVPAP